MTGRPALARRASASAAVLAALAAAWFLTRSGPAPAAGTPSTRARIDDASAPRSSGEADGRIVDGPPDGPSKEGLQSTDAGRSAGAPKHHDLDVAPTESLSGHVLDPEGRPIPDVAVTVGISGEPLHETRSLADGSFLVPRVGAGSFEAAAVAAPGLAPVASAAGRIESGTDAAGIVVVAARTREIRGFVETETGFRIPGQAVYLGEPVMTYGATMPRVDIDQMVRTDENGRFAFEEVPRIPLTLSVFPAAMLPTLLEVSADETDVVLTSEMRGRWTRLGVRVVDEAGSPVHPATVQITEIAGGARGRTDESGHYEAQTWVAKGKDASPNALVRVTAPGHGSIECVVDVQALESGSAELQLGREQVVTGRVVDAEGRAISASLELRSTTLWAGREDPVKAWRLARHEATAEDGFRVEGLGPGRYDVIVRARDGFHSRHVLDTSLSPFVLGPTPLEESFAIVEAKVRSGPSGPSLTSFMLGTYRPKSGGGSHGEWPEGRARAVEPAPEELEIRLSAKEHVEIRSRKQRLEPGRYVIEAALPRAVPLRIRLVDSSGSPLHGLRVRVPSEVVLTEPLVFSTLETSKTTPLDGRCRFDGVPEDTREIVIEEPTTGSTWRVPVPAPDAAREHEIVLGR